MYKVIVLIIILVLGIGYIFTKRLNKIIYIPNSKNLLKYNSPQGTVFKTVQQNVLTDFPLITIPKDCKIIYIDVKGTFTTSDLVNVGANIKTNSSNDYYNILSDFYNKDFNFTKPIVLKNQQIDIQFTNLNTKVSKDDFYFLQLFSNGNKTIFVENLYVEIEMSF
jgi:hypothetical protein